MNSINKRLERLLALRKKERNWRPRELVRRSSFGHFAFWQSCITKTRAKTAGVPHNITANDIEKLLTYQNWRCAVSGIHLTEPRGKKEPFAPSLDRIVPALGYVVGNVRVVCMIVNLAMNVWGEESLVKLVSEWNGNLLSEQPKVGKKQTQKALIYNITQ